MSIISDMLLPFVIRFGWEMVRLEEGTWPRGRAERTKHWLPQTLLHRGQCWTRGAQTLDGEDRRCPEGVGLPAAPAVKRAARRAPRTRGCPFRSRARLGASGPGPPNLLETL